MQERGHVIEVLEKAKDAAFREDVVELKQLSDMTVHSSAIYQDEDNILVAVILYALSKIIERGNRYYKENYKRYVRDYVKVLDKSIDFLKKEDDAGFRKEINLISSSKDISQDLKVHLIDLFRKARINKAGRVYEHGISMESTAKLLGISLWELSEYAGQSNVDGATGQGINVRQRIKIAEEIFER